jgi:hypothetical protein
VSEESLEYSGRRRDSCHGEDNFDAVVSINNTMHDKQSREAANGHGGNNSGDNGDIQFDTLEDYEDDEDDDEGMDHDGRDRRSSAAEAHARLQAQARTQGAVAAVLQHRRASV